ncbi:hypothetical protein [Halorhabdus sp. CUG00001]|uniref:hypothetical protein n=1 Tax=Halorhabdus sp. CUG00001 TaxID=2600297 RepID=UPI001E50FFEF|nr:hypothetical protein [Halorhabdus sp. CUG00001]
MASFLTKLVNSLFDAPAEFVDVASQGPISALLVALGALFVGAAVLAGGVLGLRAVVDLLTPFRSDRVHRPRDR